MLLKSHWKPTALLATFLGIVGCFVSTIGRCTLHDRALVDVDVPVVVGYGAEDSLWKVRRLRRREAPNARAIASEECMGASTKTVLACPECNELETRWLRENGWADFLDTHARNAASPRQEAYDSGAAIDR